MVSGEFGAQFLSKANAIIASSAYRLWNFRYATSENTESVDSESHSIIPAPLPVPLSGSPMGQLPVS